MGSELLEKMARSPHVVCHLPAVIKPSKIETFAGGSRGTNIDLPPPSPLPFCLSVSSFVTRLCGSLSGGRQSAVLCFFFLLLLLLSSPGPLSQKGVITFIRRRYYRRAKRVFTPSLTAKPCSDAIDPDGRGR